MPELSDLCYLRKPRMINFDGDGDGDSMCKQAFSWWWLESCDIFTSAKLVCANWKFYMCLIKVAGGGASILNYSLQLLGVFLFTVRTCEISYAFLPWLTFCKNRALNIERHLPRSMHRAVCFLKHQIR